MEKKKFKQTIYKAVRLNEAFSILDEVADGCDWSSGGCAILAQALNKLFGYPIYVVFNNGFEALENFVVNRGVEHFVVYDGETFIDGSHVYKNERELLRVFEKEENCREGELVVLPYTPELSVDGIVMDESAAVKLADFLKKRL